MFKMLGQWRPCIKEECVCWAARQFSKCVLLIKVLLDMYMFADGSGSWDSEELELGPSCNCALLVYAPSVYILL